MRFAILVVGIGIQSAAWAVAPLVKPALYRDDKILVRYTDAADTGFVRQSAASHGLALERSIAGGRIALLRTPMTMTMSQAIENLRKDRYVRFAEPDYLRFPQSFTPDDPLFGQQWGMDNIGQADFVSGRPTGTPGADLGVLQAWGSNSDGTPEQTGSGQVTVAIIDDGFELDHPDLAANFIAGYDFIHNTSNPSPDSSSDTHGTEVAGTIGAIGNNGIGVAGPIWSLKLMPLKFGQDVATEVEAMEYARAHHAQIVNFSYSGPTYSQVEANEISALADDGILFVTAAGNGGSNIDNSGAVYPALYQLPNEVVVGAMDRRGELSSFSNYGPVSVDTVAPGEEIVTTRTNRGYTTQPGVSGTSLAAGYATGGLALALDASPGSSVSDLRGSLVGSNPLSPLAADTVGGILNLGELNCLLRCYTQSLPSFHIRPFQIGSYSQSSVDGTETVPIKLPYKISYDSNGNGLLDPGETATLQLTVENQWHDATYVTEALNSSDGNSEPPPAATTLVTAAFDLPVSDSPVVVGPFDPTDGATYSEQASVVVYDSLGASHLLGLYFAHTATNGLGDWTLYSVIDGDMTQMTSIDLGFDAGGALIQPSGGVAQLTPFATVDGSDLLDMTLNLAGTSMMQGRFILLQFSQNGHYFGEGGSVTVNTQSVSLGDVPAGNSTTSTVNLSISPTAQGHQYISFTDTISADCQPPGMPIPCTPPNSYLAYRHFVIELGTLTNNVPVTQIIGTDPHDNFHTWHFTLDGPLPAGQDTLTFQTRASNDIDILVGYQAPVRYSIDLKNDTAPVLSPTPGLYYYNVSDAQAGAAPGGNEYVNLPNPQPGNYFVTVINHDRTPNASYTLTAFTSQGGVGSAASSTIAYQTSIGSSNGSGAFSPLTLLALSALIPARRRRRLH